MISHSVKNIFHRLSVADLYRPVEEGLFVDITYMIEDNLTEYFRQLQPQHRHLYHIVGYYALLIFSEDIPKFTRLFRNSADEFLKSDPQILSNIQYKFLSMDQIEKFDPPAGFLYNTIKSEKDTKFIICRGESDVIGIAKYDNAVSLLRTKVSAFL